MVIFSRQFIFIPFILSCYLSKKLLLITVAYCYSDILDLADAESNPLGTCLCPAQCYCINLYFTLQYWYTLSLFLIIYYFLNLSLKPFYGTTNENVCADTHVL